LYLELELNEKENKSHTLNASNKVNQRDPVRIDKTRIKVINIANTTGINKNALIRFFRHPIITAEMLSKFLRK
jgi:hypothetical protein